MPGESPDPVTEVAFSQTLATLGSLQPGETISVDELFHDVGQRLVAEGLAAKEAGLEEWAHTMADNFVREHRSSTDKVVDDKKE